MSYPVFAIANAFIEKGISDLTPMKLQKLIYYANYWYLKNTKESLIDESFCRWQYGPVIPSLYHQLKNYGATPIKNKLSWACINPETKKIEAYTPSLKEDAKNARFYIDEVTKKYGKYSGAVLSTMTHCEKGAWGKKQQGTFIDIKELQDAEEQTP